MRQITLISTIALVVVAISCWNCSSSSNQDTRPKVVVSIAPLAYLTQAIADSTVDIEVLVPETTSPETFEPTIAQLKSLTKAKAYIAIGLIDFEVELKHKIKELAPHAEYVDLSEGGLELMQGTCSHIPHNPSIEHQNPTENTPQDHAKAHNHSGIDPHIWLSPRLLKIISANIAQSLCNQLPENRELYTQNLHKLYLELDSLNNFITNTLKTKKVRKFAIAHPSLSYFAQDYNLEQIPIEVDGKEPSAGQLSALITRLKNDTITTIFYQRQISGASVDVIAKHVAGHGQQFDPLSRNVVDNLRQITIKLDQTLR